jgi:hypothetical protein
MRPILDTAIAVLYSAFAVYSGDAVISWVAGWLGAMCVIGWGTYFAGRTEA